jgi:hypothetical protein
MKYVFNPRNRQINPVTEQTFVDPTLRDKVVSAELYALVCKGKISVEDIAALFAVNKSPEILLKNHKAVKESPVATAPANTTTLPESALKTEGDPTVGAEEEAADANGAFDGSELCSKKVPELLVIASTVGIDVNAEGFVPTRGNLIKAIMAKAKAAEEGAKPAEPTAPAAPAVPPVAE